METFPYFNVFMKLLIYQIHSWTLGVYNYVFLYLDKHSFSGECPWALLFIQLTYWIPVISMYLQAEWKTVWILNIRSQLRWIYSTTCLKRPLKKKTKIVFQDRLSVNTGQKYCRMLQESILQYFRTSLSYYLSLRSLFCLFWSGCLRQVLLYTVFKTGYIIGIHGTISISLHAG